MISRFSAFSSACLVKLNEPVRTVVRNRVPVVDERRDAVVLRKRRGGVAVCLVYFLSSIIWFSRPRPGGRQMNTTVPSNNNQTVPGSGTTMPSRNQ